MKKIILLIAAVLSMVNFGLAQGYGTDYRDKLMLGLKIGTNYSNVYDTQGEEFDANAKFGMATGMFLTIPIGKSIGLHPEILLSQKGFKAKGIILSNTYEFTRTTTYIDVPILFELKPMGFLTLLFGPQYSFLAKKKDVFANATTSIEQEQEFMNDNVRKSTFCLLVGADINVDHLVLGARANWDILTNNGNDASTTPRYKNVWYQFTIGYRFYND